MHKEPAGKVLEGKIQHHGTFGFLLSEKPGEQDLMLRGPSLRLAMDGDRVQARLTPGSKSRPSGEIVKVLERARQTVTGVLTQKDGRWMVASEEGDERDAITALGFAPGITQRTGEVVVVRITRWPTLQETAAGEVVEALGLPSEPGVRLRAVLRTRNLPEAFPEAVLSESRTFPEAVSPEMWQGRLDLRAVPLFTIDGADAKDFDDAVSLEALGPGRMRLGVHIADVSHYVKKGTALDAEAAERATSVYLADRVVPMLPPNLSDHLCSLMPDVERLTLSCFMEVDAYGGVKASELKETVIRSRRRFTYEEVETILEGKEVANVAADVKEAVLRMGTLAKALNVARMRRGALDFTMPEYKVEVDPHGTPLRVVKRDRLQSHRLIEEFMLLANETVASSLLQRRIPFLSRIHPDPDPKKLSQLAADLLKLGITAPNYLLTNTASALQAILRGVARRPLEETINMLVVRSLMQATYSSTPGEHFGLASEAYCHFTSPIRRYPDLVTHRAVRAAVRGVPGTELGQGLTKLGEHCSERERVAADAEHASVDILRAELLKKRTGEVFSGVVSGSAAFGVFVTLDDLGAAGLVRNSSMPLGSRVQVKLQKVNDGKGELDLSLLSSPKAAPEGKPRWEKPRWDPNRPKFIPKRPGHQRFDPSKPRPERSSEAPKPKWQGHKPKWEGKPKWDPTKPRFERKFDPSKPRPERKFDPSKPKFERKFDPSKPKWDPTKPRFERKFDPSKPRPKWSSDKPKWDPSKPRPERKFDPSKPRPKWSSDKPKWDPSKPRPERKFDPNKPRPNWGAGKPKWDPNKPKPKWSSDKPKWGPKKKWEPRSPARRPDAGAPKDAPSKPKFYDRFIKKGPRKD